MFTHAVYNILGSENHDMHANEAAELWGADTDSGADADAEDSNTNLTGKITLLPN